MKSALEVWQLVMVAKDYSMDVNAIAHHLVLTQAQVRSALDYYAAYPEEIDLALDENNLGFDRLKEILPNLERIHVLPSTDGRENG